MMRLLRYFCLGKKKMPKSARQPSYNLLPDQLSFDENDQLALIDENCREATQQTLMKTNSFAQDFYGCSFDEEGLLHHTDEQPAYGISFAQDVYGCGHDAGGLLDYTDDQPAPNIARARYRMECVTGSQLAVLVQELGADFGEGGGAGDHDPSLLVDKVMAWRKKRGDFDDDEGEDQGGFVGDEVPQLTSDMRDVSETILRWGFLKSDLQLECLLRNIAYAGSDGKAQLISKLMDYKDTLFRKGNSLQMLEEECK